MREERTESLVYMETLSPNPWDLPLYGKHAACRGDVAAPAHACASDSAPVASLRSRILCQGDVQYRPGVCRCQTLLPDPGPARGKLLLSRHSLWPVLKCPSMAAFQVSPEAQGGPLSPLLSNIVLDEFDREL